MANESRLYHSNRSSAESACLHCGGIVRHQPWCLTRNENVIYAFAVALGLRQLTPEDQLLLHALGVSWPPPETIPQP